MEEEVQPQEWQDPRVTFIKEAEDNPDKTFLYLDVSGRVGKESRIPTNFHFSNGFIREDDRLSLPDKFADKVREVMLFGAMRERRPYGLDRLLWEIHRVLKYPGEFELVEQIVDQVPELPDIEDALEEHGFAVIEKKEVRVGRGRIPSLFQLRAVKL